MAEHTINLSEAQENAFADMLGSAYDLEVYLQNIANAHIRQQLDDEWAKLSDEQKQAKLEE